MLPINRSWRNLVQYLQKYPSAKMDGKVDASKIIAAEAKLFSTYKFQLLLFY